MLPMSKTEKWETIRDIMKDEDVKLRKANEESSSSSISLFNNEHD